MNFELKKHEIVHFQRNFISSHIYIIEESFPGKLWRAATEPFESHMRLASRGLVTTGLM